VADRDPAATGGAHEVPGTTTEPQPAAAVETRVVAAGASDAGRVRAMNQDAFWSGQVGRKGFLAVVADGMGGHQTGEVASQQALETFRTSLASLRAHPPAALAAPRRRPTSRCTRWRPSDPSTRGWAPPSRRC